MSQWVFIYLTVCPAHLNFFCSGELNCNSKFFLGEFFRSHLFTLSFHTGSCPYFIPQFWIVTCTSVEVYIINSFIMYTSSFLFPASTWNFQKTLMRPKRESEWFDDSKNDVEREWCDFLQKIFRSTNRKCSWTGFRFGHWAGTSNVIPTLIGHTMMFTAPWSKSNKENTWSIVSFFPVIHGTLVQCHAGLSRLGCRIPHLQDRDTTAAWHDKKCWVAELWSGR